MVDKARTAADWQAIRRICALTGKAGDPVEPERRDAFAELWIAPYEKLVPEWAWVVRGPGGDDVAGYLVAAPDTRAFRRRKAMLCDVALLVRLVTSRRARTEDTDAYVRRLLRLAPDPERAFVASDRQRIVGAFPAHLHVNLLPQARRQGYGAQMIGALARDLGGRGISGVHCLCGEGPTPFYERQGFRRIAEAVFGNGIRLFVMGRGIASG